MRRLSILPALLSLALLLFASAGCQSAPGGSQTGQGPAIDSVYADLVRKNQFSEQSDWREARNRLYAAFSEEAAGPSDDASLEQAFEQAAVLSQRDYYSKAYGEQRHETHLVWTISLLTVLVLLAAGFFLILAYRRKKTSARVREEALRNLATMLTRQVDELQNEQEVLQQQVAKGLRSRYLEMGEFFKTAATVNEDNQLVKQGILYDKVKKAMNAFIADQDGKMLLEEQLNQGFDQVMANYRKEFPNRTEDHYRFVAYIFAGFDKDTVSAFTGIQSRDAIYSRKKRLRQEIGRSDVPHKAQFLRLLPMISVILICLSCSQPATCVIDGTVSDARVGAGATAVIQTVGEKGLSAPVVDGSFQLRVPRSKEVFRSIDFYDKDGNRIGRDEMDLFMEVITETKRMSVNFDTGTIVGSPLSEQLNRLVDQTLHAFDWTQEMDAAQHAGDELMLQRLLQGSQKRYSSLLLSEWRAHPHDAVGLQALIWIAPMLSLSELDHILAISDGFIRNHPQIIKVRQQLASAEELSAFYAHLGSGKPVLALCWAAWSRASLRELQAVDSLARELHSEPLTIVCINVADTHEAMERAILDRQIGVEQVFDPYGQLAEQFGVDSLPCLLHFNTAGKLIQKTANSGEIRLSSLH